jgi:mycothiol system anti-sigma-R factor
VSKECDRCHYHVYDYIDRELSWMAQFRIRWHLRRCPGCDQAYRFEERLLVVVKRHLREDAPPEVLERLRRTLGEEK